MHPTRRRRDAGRSRSSASASNRFSLPGRPINCTPTGSAPRSTTGTVTTGTPASVIGWVKTPTFGRISVSTPSMTIVRCPIGVAGYGVAAAMRTS